MQQNSSQDWRQKNTGNQRLNLRSATVTRQSSKYDKNDDRGRGRSPGRGPKATRPRTPSKSPAHKSKNDDSKAESRRRCRDKSHSKAKPASSRKATRSATAPAGKAVKEPPSRKEPRRKDESKTRHDKVPLQGPGNVKRTQSKAPTPVVSKQPKVEKVEARPATAQVDSSSSGESSSSEYTYVTTEEGVGENEAPQPAAPGAAAKAKPKAAPPGTCTSSGACASSCRASSAKPICRAQRRFERNSRLLPKSSKLFANCRPPLRPINRSVCKLFVGVGQLAAQ